MVRPASVWRRMPWAVFGSTFPTCGDCGEMAQVFDRSLRSSASVTAQYVFASAKPRKEDEPEHNTAHQEPTTSLNCVGIAPRVQSRLCGACAWCGYGYGRFSLQIESTPETMCRV